VSPAAILAEGLADLGLDLGADAQSRLLDYLHLLGRWNRTYNLTSVRAELAMVSAHLLDALSVLPYLGSPASLADVGSGAGLPGLPLAIAEPGMSVSLIESVQKKASFLTQAKIDLKLENVSIYCNRAEELAGSALWQPVEVVISRAFADLASYVRLAGGLLAPGGRMLAMKGAYPAEEIAALPAGWAVRNCLPLAVPGLAAQRHLIILEKV